MRVLGALLSLVLVLSLCNQPHAKASKRGAKAKPAASKSPDTAGLKRDHPNDPVKWFDQVNVHFKAGEKNKVADLLHDASREFPHQPDMRFNHAFVRYELGEYDVAVHVLEKLVKPRRRQRAPATDSPPAAGRPAEDGNPAVGAEVEAGGVPVESKWVDLLIKGYVKVGRVADAVRLTDEQLLRIDRVPGVVLEQLEDALGCARRPDHVGRADARGHARARGARALLSDAGKLVDCERDEEHAAFYQPLVNRFPRCREGETALGRQIFEEFDGIPTRQLTESHLHASQVVVSPAVILVVNRQLQ